MSLINILKICTTTNEANKEARRISALLPDWDYYVNRNILSRGDDSIYVAHHSVNLDMYLAGTVWDALVIVRCTEVLASVCQSSILSRIKGDTFVDDVIGVVCVDGDIVYAKLKRGEYNESR